MTSHSPPSPRQQKSFTQDSPAHVESRQSIYSDYSDVQEDPRSALQDLGLSIPVILYQTFLDHLAPPQPDFDFDSTIQSLKLGSEPVLTSSNQWTMFTNSPKDSQGSEYTIFSPIPEIFTKVVVSIIANSGGKLNEDKNVVDFLQNPSRTPTSAERNKMSRPDGYLVFKDRIKVMSKGGRKEDIRWGDIALSWEYKRKGGVNELDDDVRKCLWSLQHMMRDDPRRRATFGLTIENCTTRVWFCCRSLLVVSESFDFIAEPVKLVILFAAFAFADQKSLGFDPTVQRNRGQFVITINPDNEKQSPRRFQTRQTVSSSGAESLLGRGTRVFEAVEIDGNGNPSGSPVVLKDTWVDSDRTREGNVIALLHTEANCEDRKLIKKHFLTTICHGDVWTDPDIRDDTANSLMRGLDITSDHVSLFKLQVKPFSRTYESLSGSESSKEYCRVRAPHPYLSYAHKTHYRIVFKEKGITIDRVKKLPEVMTVLGETVGALRLLRKLGWVHRDVSIGNILSCDGHAKLADLEYAKKMGDLKSDEMRTGTKNFMSIEAAAQRFLFKPSLCSSVPVRSSSKFKQLRMAKQRGTGMAQTEMPFFHNHLHDLESLWWVAVWVVFYNNFSEPEPSFTLLDAECWLDTVRKLFPPTLDNATRRDGFQLPTLFRKICDGLPHNKGEIYDCLDLIREFLIDHYEIVEAGYPPSINVDVSNDDIYDAFTEGFSDLQSLSDGLVLHSFPAIYATLSKAENSKRSESTDDTGLVQQKSA